MELDRYADQSDFGPEIEKMLLHAIAGTKDPGRPALLYVYGKQRVDVPVVRKLPSLMNLTCIPVFRNESV